jgi:ribosomal protein S18 acetylase RimI-like enzyme
MINIRLGKIEDLLQLNQDWAWGKEDWARENQQKVIKDSKDGTHSFLVVEDNNKVIGELHIIWNQKEDQDEANGKDRAYLSTLRLHPNYREKGIGTKLMKAALKHIKEKGFIQATIGAYTHEQHIQTLYKKWGFTKQIKECTEKLGENETTYILLIQRLF